MALKKIHTVEVKRKAAKDGFGQDSYGNVETFAARFNNEVKEFISEQGAELMSVGTIYFEPPATLVVGDLVRKQGIGEFQPVRAIAEYPNGSGSKQINIAYLTANVR